MAASRRRKGKTRTKVSVRPRKKPFSRSLLPKELQSQSQAIQDKLGLVAVWDSQSRLQNNYDANGLLSDCNARFGRNCKLQAGPIKDKAEATEHDPDAAGQSDDDLRQAEGKTRRDGKKAEPAKLTSHQYLIVERLIQAHGSNIAAMVKDRKLNSMLLPASKLQKLIAGYEAFGSRGRCQFRTPLKHL